MYTISHLFDTDHTLAGAYLQGFTYPWEALKGIKDLILRHKKEGGITTGELQRTAKHVLQFILDFKKL